jgi:hypothetical protein
MDGFYVLRNSLKINSSHATRNRVGYIEQYSSGSKGTNLSV